MTCERACELSALAASGEITTAEQHLLAAHTVSCNQCRAEVEAFESLRSQLTTLREDSAPDYVYSAVRARVAAEIASRHRPAWIAAWASLAAAVVCALVVIVEFHPQAPVTVPDDKQIPVHVVQAGPSTADAPVPVRHVRRKSVVSLTPEPAEPLVIRMLTDDPDVVMYWIADAAPEKKFTKEMIQ